MKKFIYLMFIIILLSLSGCGFLNKTGSVIGHVMSGGKIHITLAVETDAAYNNNE